MHKLKAKIASLEKYASAHNLLDKAEALFLRHGGPVARLWLKLSGTARAVVINLLIGLGIGLWLFTQTNSDLIRKAEYNGIDWVLNQYRGSAPAHPERAVPFTFIHVDEETYREWGEPIFTPRDKLAALIRYARENGAASIVVDIALDRPTPDDVPLQEELSSFNQPGNRTHLFQIRTFMAPLEGETGLTRLRTSFLDKTFGLDHPYIHPASSLYNLAEDGVVRHWRVWEPVCHVGKDGAAQPVALPSVQLATLAISHDQYAQLKQTLANQLTPGCDQAVELPDQIFRVDSRLAVHLGGDRIKKTILYSIPWQLKPGESRPQIEWNGTPTPLLTKIPARRIIQQPDLKEDLNGQIVIIGTSHAEARDTHMTPFGEMPGAMIIINAIHSILQHGEIQPPGLLGKLLLQSALIVVMSLIFARWRSLAGAVITYVLIVAAMLPLSLWLFKAGMWLDFALPLLAVQLHQVAKSFHERIDRARQMAQIESNNSSNQEKTA
ncbi:sensor domain CHASE2-containing protein [Formivibrio citricus]|uniref:Sensor domain CHASE2-containing protein n=1 Tax=Formivibrio citricus TaxID=83765 RepID=A0A1I5E2M5_9NEIS|nr:CHASE2 domain-containing protein [Formivibrio citricus]SFO05769.1 sensor domain CHASE2-containing protein [Formivibrio citricus]